MKVEINIPESLKDITLQQYQTSLLIEEPTNDDLLSCFLNLTQEEINNIKATEVDRLVIHLNSLFEVEQQHTLKSDLNGVTFGFIPNLDAITYGENKDITTYVNDWQKMNMAMAVLYRPIKQKQGNKYILEDYEGTQEYSELMKQMPLSVVLGSMVFLSFNKRIAELYPELFGEGDSETNEERQNFGRKWGSYQELDSLSQGDIRRFDDITNLSLHTCLMKLAFEIDKANFENRQMKRNFKK